MVLSSVLEFSGNCKSDLLDFLGWYQYVDSSRDELDVTVAALLELVVGSLRSAKKNQREQHCIMILRDGIIEKQYKSMLDQKREGGRCLTYIIMLHFQII